jgi:RNA polymerase sigma factor (sigma-70 family)
MRAKKRNGSGRPVSPAEAGDIPTIEVVYQAERGALLRLAYLMVGSQAVAEDLTHEAFTRLLPRFDEVDNPGAFLRTVVSRLCLTWLGRASMERERLGRVDATPPVGAPELDEMLDALDRLRPERKAVLVLRYYADLDHAAIADVLGCPTATVRTRLHRGLADLRKDLDR